MGCGSAQRTYSFIVKKLNLNQIRPMLNNSQRVESSIIYWVIAYSCMNTKVTVSDSTNLTLEEVAQK